MKTLTVAEFKANFSDVIQAVKKGEEIAVEYGRKHETVGVFVPISKYSRLSTRRLGILEKKGTFRMAPDFKMSDDEFFAS